MTIFTDKAVKYIPKLQIDLGLTREQACGIFGNLGTETGGFTALQEKAPVIKGSKGGYGWMQWTGPRRRKYEAWCQTNKLNPADDDTNYKYLVQETKTDEVHSLIQLRKTTTVETATETFMRQNLRPGVPHLENRIQWAKKAAEATKNGAAATTAVVAGGGGAIVAASQTEPKYWIWIGLAAVVVAIVGWIVAKRIQYHNMNQTHVPLVPVKSKSKGKKNVKKEN